MQVGTSRYALAGSTRVGYPGSSKNMLCHTQHNVAVVILLLPASSVAMHNRGASLSALPAAMHNRGASLPALPVAMHTRGQFGVIGDEVGKPKGTHLDRASYALVFHSAR